MCNSKERMELIKSLKPCPFNCGWGECNREMWVIDREVVVPMTERGNVEFSYAIRCQKDATMRTRFYPTLEQAVKAWNDKIV